MENVWNLVTKELVYVKVIINVDFNEMLIYDTILVKHCL